MQILLLQITLQNSFAAATLFLFLLWAMSIGSADFKAEFSEETMLGEFRSVKCQMSSSVSMTEQNQFCRPKAEKPYHTTAERNAGGIDLKGKSV